ncbi:Pre-mRNA-splicing factor ATP-dependent RNA helicase-like protein cdc28 [Zancudomyces culisetae]|uniref:RNA helicase n=1 Tax=Zancudomyces culisetae TaxID=1213189 RepID=A0A1R1PW85_ZANCU|nr:Pre-mRNA-splicing factor ATP-dependent RNA helicase-like protein cdc28 [Zancudomyces culisetae]|eukprot:OMH85218.1 Pre-mRNA-splicing factor ATP-dependent RNA helicase-like protein cdc28 [Zancudomyces culisetae]
MANPKRKTDKVEKSRESVNKAKERKVELEGYDGDKTEQKSQEKPPKLDSIGKSTQIAVKGKRKKDILEDLEDDSEDERQRIEEIKRLRKGHREGMKGRGKEGKSGEEDVGEEGEEEKEKRDLKEREEFEQRLKERDEKGTKKIVEDTATKELKERKKLLNDTEKRREMVPELRLKARQRYLGVREEQQLELLRREIQEEEYLFSNERLKDKEIKELEYKKNLLRLATERKQLSNKYEGYEMPEDYITEKGKIDKQKKEQALYQRYIEPEGAVGMTEQEIWEKQQVEKSAGIKAKSKDKGSELRREKVKEKDEEEEKEYEYILDTEAIDFVMEETLFNEEEKTERNKQLDEIERKAQSIKQVRESLPVFKYRSELLDAIDRFQTLIIVGETGSGKTTQLPQYLHEAGYTKDGKRVGCTQPRRVAAMSVAARVAEETGTKLGHEVGYSIRFEDCSSDRTKIKYMTDGMLLREFMTEPDLSTYSCIMIDEAHERTLHTDILFSLIKDIARFRDDLKILISSATMDAQKFSKYFDDAPIFKIPGRPYPVDIYNTKAPEANYLTAAVTTVLQIHVSQPKGDILVFLTGQEEIEAAQEGLVAACRALGSKIKELLICPIYANLPSDLQAKIFEPTPENSRKVILATNIAETSITIDGVVYVIDPGFCKQNIYNPRSGVESLQVVPVSRASANQRAGRAGRVGPGKCFRLYTQHSYLNELEDSTSPEILRVNLSSVVLLLKCLGIHNLIQFDFMDKPSPELLKLSLEQLYALGALNEKGMLTKLGRRMAEFPMDPMMARAIIASEQFNCPNEMASVIAMLSVSGSVFYRPKEKKLVVDQLHATFHDSKGDHLTLLNIWNAFVDSGYSLQFCLENYLQYRSLNRARDTRDQIVSLMERVEINLSTNQNDENDTNNVQNSSSLTADLNESLRKALTAGFFYNAAKLNKSNASYSTVKKNNTIYIHPSSCLFSAKEDPHSLPKFVVYYELVLTTKEYMRQLIEINPNWLTELAPHLYSPNEVKFT